MRMLKIRNTAVLVALSLSLGGLGTPANAAVVLLSESRDVYASASVNTAIGSESASSSRNSLGDFADFDKSVAVGASLGEASASASAEQTSHISTTSISATGMATASAEINPFDPSFFTSANASANTSLFVSFELASPQRFDLSGKVSSDADLFGFGQAGVSLTSQDGSFSLSLSTPFSGGQTTPFDLSGTLFPNIYTVTANANIGANAFFDADPVSGTSEFSFELEFLPDPLRYLALVPVPLPAAFWLFAGGLIGLVGIARGGKTA
jgi:hypothetical protein